MTVIRPNSISGVTSITALANEINVFKHDGVLAGLQLNGVNHHTSSGVSTFHTLNVLGNVSVGGVLTYQDVTNVDSVGIVTARAGVDITGGSLSLDAGGAERFNVAHTSGGHVLIKNPSAASLAFGTNNIERLRIKSDGKVGIGTENPQRLLHLQSTGDALARITSADGNASYLELGDVSDPDGGKIVYDSGSNLELYTASSPRLRITSDGDITFGIQSGAAAPNSSTQIRHFDFGRDHWNGTAGDYRALRLKIYSYGNDDVYGLGISANTLEIQSQHSIAFFTGSAGAGTGRRNLRATMDNYGIFRCRNGVKLQIDAASNADAHALINLGSDHGTNTETRAIDVEGNWSNGENKSISFTHGTGSIDLVGQINSIHHSPGSSLRWGKLYHSGNSSTYTMTLDSTSSTTADLNLQGRFRSTLHPAFSVAANGGQSNIGTSDTKIVYSVPSTIGRNQSNCYDTTNHRFVAPVNGVYTFYARHWFNNYQTGTITLKFYRNGGQMKESRLSIGTNASDYNTVQLTTTVYLSATNYVEVYGVSSSGSPFHVSSGSFHTEFSGYLVC